MEPQCLTPVKARTSRSSLQVDEDVHFVVDGSEFSFSSTPSEKRGKKKFESTDSKKSFKRNSSVKPENTPRNSTASYTKQSKSKSLEPPLINCDEDSSSDSEIEILEVRLSSANEKSANVSIRKLSSTQRCLNGKKNNKCFESMAKKELLINEAEIAPFVPPPNPKILSSPCNRTSSMGWPSSSSTVSVTGYSPGSFTSILKPRVNSNPNAESSDKILMPEIEATKEKPKGKRELKGLYENLNEISWAHETSFKNLLRRPDYIRHSERSTGRIAGTGKNLRTLKSAAQIKNVKKVKQKSALNILARKKSKMAMLNQRQKGQQTRGNGKINKKTSIGNKKKIAVKSESLPVAQQFIDDEVNVRYKLAPHLMSKPAELARGKINEPVTKMSNGLKVKSDPTKAKSNSSKIKLDKSKVKSDVVKQKNYIPSIKYDNSPPNSGLRKPVMLNSENSSSSKSKIKPFSRSSFDELSEDFKRYQNLLNSNPEHIRAAKKAPNLRVNLQPLELTKMWDSGLNNEFRRIILQEACEQARDQRDLGSIMSMQHCMFESFMNSQYEASNGGPSNGRSKKKKPEEEALRSSVRQSEGANRYKEIVVKKHKHYFQVILVPNSAKQNSLTIDAIKELKDAFVIAKKDSNCKAVLLSSAGSYFCSGIDLAPLIGPNRKQAGDELSFQIQDLVLTLAFFTKPLIAAVNGTTNGFGVSLLTFCDIVMASDKATFYLPAIKLGYVPEGGATFTLPKLMGTTW
ncbi:chromodomain Y-like protein [Caerostris extrusa]|uniref:Chromodomain Y-like protein n=1 Tax=Caerostris extrusa TaxID=172846 RepID=A0AAV4NX15_CAEEX|nr:chromodomain Y-like protein [Caerostris extrusa]